MKTLLLVALGFILLAGVGAAIYIGIACPCERLPGVALWGEEQPNPVEDWRFVNEAPLCQLQVSGGLLPQSLNLNCMADDNGELFVSCAGCADKRWSATAVAHPNGRIRIGEKVYPVQLTRLTDPARLDHAWAARRQKLETLGRGALDKRPDHWWSFQLTSRRL